MRNLEGKFLGNYRLIRLLGSGGFADVYLGEHLYLKRFAAIKIQHMRFDQVEMQAAFLKEAQTLAQLQHPNIIDVFEYGIADDGSPYFVMDYAANGTLKDRYQHGTQIPLRDILSNVKQIASALQYAHDRLIIHRDVKPGNMLIGANDIILLSDFGIATVAHSDSSMSYQSRIVGTPIYMSPEHFQGKVQIESDQYALGVVVYDWLCGNPPFRGNDVLDLANQHVHAAPPSLQERVPNISSGIEQVVMKALAKDPRDRFESVLAFADALEKAIISSSQKTFGAWGGTVGTRFIATIVAADQSISDTDISMPTPEESPDHEDLWPPSPNASAQSAGNMYVADERIVQLLEQAEDYYKAKQHEEAIEIYDKVIKIDPHNAAAYGKKGNALGKRGRFKQAIAAYEKMLEIEPQHASIWLAKGDVLVKLKRYQEALKSYDQALAINPKDSQALFAKADILCKLKLSDEAIHVYNQALEIAPDNALIWSHKGDALRKMQLYEEALVAYDAALLCQSNNALLWMAKGNILFDKLKKYEEALKAYISAAGIMPKRPSIWVAKGKVLLHMKRYDEALAAYERAFVLNPADDTVVRQCEMLRELKASKKQPDAFIDNNPRPGPMIIFNPHGTDEHLTNATSRTRILEEYNYDAFLAHDLTDVKWVEEHLAQPLEDEHHLRVWLEKWEMVPGKLQQQQLFQGFGQAKCCVVCIGRQTPAEWFEQIIEAALDKQAQEPTFGVIPVLLPQTNDVNLSHFLKLRTLVNFRDLEYAYAFHLLICGIKGIPPGRGPQTENRMIGPGAVAEEMLQQLNDFKRKGLIKDAIADDTVRIVLEKVWLTGWTKERDDKHE